MINVYPRNYALSSETIEAYMNIVPATLGHALEGGMDGGIKAIWSPVKLVGPALTVQTSPQTAAAVGKALEVSKPGDVLVVNRGGDQRHATFGEIAALGAIEYGIAGIISDGVITDREALQRLKFPAYARGVTAMTIKPWDIPEGAVNVPVSVGGIGVNPGDLILADDDGVMVASPSDAQLYLAFCEEKDAWEAWVRSELEKGRSFSDVVKERPWPVPNLMQ